MNKKNEEIIKEILQLINSENKEFDGFLKTVRFKGNIKSLDDVEKIKSNPWFTLIGKEKISRYESLFKMLLDNLKYNSKFTLESFMELLQDLIFKNQFNIKSIKELLEKSKEENVIIVRKIYGITLQSKRVKKYGDFIFVRKDYIKKFLNNIRVSNQLNLINKQSIINKMIKFNSDNFVYVVFNSKTYDFNLLNIEFEYKLKQIIYLIRFLCGEKNPRKYVDYKPVNTYKKNTIILSESGKCNASSKIQLKDIPFKLDDKLFYSRTNGSKFLWELLSKSKLNEFENRILNACLFIGEAIHEENDYISFIEIAFAFESILYLQTRGEITKGITATLSENYAYINGKTIQERIDLAKEFKNFYSIRSSIVHGYIEDKNIVNNLNKYFGMIYKTIRNVIKSRKLISCKTLEDVNKYIIYLRYK